MTRNRSEQGQAIVLLALLITGMVAVAGLAIDGGRLYSARRNAQNAADNAALAAAQAMCSDQSASTAALASAGTNSFNNDGATNTVDVNVPPSGGPNAGDSEYIEIVISSSEVGTISQLVFQGELAYSARAVGHCTNSVVPPGNGHALIVLHDEGGPSYTNPYDRYPLKSKPGGLVNVDGTIFVNTGSPSGYSSYGHDCGQSAASYGVKADAGFVVGGIYEDCPPDYINPNPSTGATPMADPLAALAGPADPAGSCVAYSSNSGNSSINPGEYCSITLSGGADVTLNPGVYYINGGDINLSVNSRLTANNVMLYLNTGDISVTDNADLIMSAPTSGVYKGMALFMDNGTSFYVHKNATVTVNGGTLYAPNAFVQVYGLNAGNHTFFQANGSQMIVDSLWVGSSSNCTIHSNCPNTRGDLILTYDSSLIYGTAGASMIELSE